MPSTSIGYLSFWKDPRDGIVPMRFRALHVEAMLLDASFVLLDWSDFDEADERILTWSWSPDGWKSERRELPDVVIIMGEFVNKQQERLNEWLLEKRPCIQDIGPNKLGLVNLLVQSEYKKWVLTRTAGLFPVKS